MRGFVLAAQDIAAAAETHGHIQECIIQPYSPGERDTWAPPTAWDPWELPRLVEFARAVLPPTVAVQVPPNLVAGGELLRACLEAGATDLGGIRSVFETVPGLNVWAFAPCGDNLLVSTCSPRDEVNPSYGFPTGATLERLLAGWGFALQKRRAVHPRLEAWAYGGGLPHAASGLPQVAMYDMDNRQSTS